MVKLLLLAALVAGPALGQRFTPPPGWTPVPPRPTGYAMPAPPALASQWTVYEADSRCPADASRTVTVPRPESVRCWQTRAMEYLVGELQAKRLTPGSRASGPLYYPPVRFAMSRRYVEGLNAGVPWNGCAGGIAYKDYSFVFLTDPLQTLRLVTWEMTNANLAYVLDRWDLTDGAAVVGAAVTYAQGNCPAY